MELQTGYKDKFNINLHQMDIPQNDKKPTLAPINVEDRGEVNNNVPDKFSEDAQNSSEGDQPFSDIDNILAQEDTKQSRQEIILTFKVNELQKICSTLTTANQQLLDKIEDLEEEREAKNISQNVFSDEYSEMQCDFNDVELMLRQYREDLRQYQEKMKTEIIHKNQTVAKLKNDIVDLKEAMGQLEADLTESCKLNSNLEAKNEALILELDDIETNSKKQKYSRISSHPKYAFEMYDEEEYTSEFSSTVQSELERLIEKLMSQLVHERNIKKKITEEMRRLQKELLDSEREIKVKNNRIYELEMEVLKANKASSFNPTKFSREVVSERSREDHQNYRPRTPRNFTIADIASKGNEWSIEDRLRVSVKVIEFYTNKLNRRDYKDLLPEDIQVSNFNKRNLNLTLVRNISPDHGKSHHSSGNSQQSVFLNLGGILDMILGAALEEEADTNDQLLQILQKMNQLTDRSRPKGTKNLQELKSTVEAALGQYPA